MRNHRTKNHGYSLLELLVAMSIMIILGSGLVALLKVGINTWHIAEKRGAIYDRSRMVLDQLAEDLRAAAGVSRAEGAGFWIRFLCDTDRQGRPRLRFTRALSGETQDPIAREGGKYVETFAGAVYDLHHDAADMEEGRLLAPGGYQEVIYAMDPDRNLLWRGVRSPIGGAGSLFIERNLEGEEPRSRALGSPLGDRRAPPPKRRAAAGALAEGRDEPGPLLPLPTGANAPPAVAGRAGRLEKAARPFAEGILHLSFAFWTQSTDTWDRSHPPRLEKAPGERSGPVLTWDSTRGLLDEQPTAGEFTWLRVEGSLEDPSDDLFPERVEITLVIEGNADVAAATLAEDIDQRAREIPLSNTDGFPEDGPNRFVKIEGEWICYQRIERGRLILPRAGRGARGTAPAPHVRGAPVDLGTTFRRVVEIPAVRMETRPAGEKRRRP